MNDLKIEIAQDQDADEIIKLVNLCFEKDMVKSVPVLYNENKNRMKNHYIIKEDDKIVAIFCLLCRDLVCLEDTLKIGEIGSVCVHKDYRNQGLMQQMLNYANKLLREQNCDIGFLSGKYERYHHFLYESSNQCYYVSYSASRNINPDIHFCKMEEGNNEYVDYSLTLYEQSELYIKRTKKDFIDNCIQWCKEGYFILHQSHIIGYLVYFPLENEIEEIKVEDKKQLKGIITTFMAYKQLDKIKRKILNSDYDKENTSNKMIYNKNNKLFQIIHLEKVISVFLNYRLSHEILKEGSLGIKVIAYGTFTIEVYEGKAIVSNKSKHFDLEVSYDEMQKIILQTNSVVLEKNRVNELLESWFPLPIFLLDSDQI